MLTLKGFISAWSYFQLAVTLYIAVAVQEGKTTKSNLKTEAEKKIDKEATGETGAESENEEEEEEHHVYTLKESFMILIDIMKNKNLQTYFIFRTILIAAMSINYNVSSVYLTNDVSKSSFLIVCIVEIPCGKSINDCSSFSSF